MNNRCKDRINQDIAINYPRAFINIGLLSLVTCLIFIMISSNVYGTEKGDPVRGKSAFSKRTCSLCHSINGKGGSVGPDLTDINKRRSEEWLFKWLKDPTLIKADTIMPKMKWGSDQEILDIIYYLKNP